MSESQDHFLDSSISFQQDHIIRELIGDKSLEVLRQELNTLRSSSPDNFEELVATYEKAIDLLEGEEGQ